LDSSAIFKVEKCDDAGDFTCFGSGRIPVQEKVSGIYLYDLLSDITVAYFVLDFGIDKPDLYRIIVDFGPYSYSKEVLDAIRSVLIAAKKAN
jgi:hypothetical protein